MRKEILLGFLLLVTTTLGTIPVYSQTGASDVDNDSIPDNVDDCPHLPEDFEGEIDGCPSEHEIFHDQDQDGIEDHDDQCPNVAETYNKYQDEDGCPDYAGHGKSHVQKGIHQFHLQSLQVNVDSHLHYQEYCRYQHQKLQFENILE